MKVDKANLMSSDWPYDFIEGTCKLVVVGKEIQVLETCTRLEAAVWASWFSYLWCCVRFSTNLKTYLCFLHYKRTGHLKIQT